MTLDEAILHAEEVAKENSKSYEEWLACKNRGNAGWSKHDIKSVDKSIEQCQKCAAEHRQLAEWLKDYKRLKGQGPKWIPVSEGLPEKNGWYSCTVELSNWPDSHYVTMDLYFKNGKWLDNRRINMFDCYEVYGFGKLTEKHKLDYSELLEDFDWTEKVMAWMPLPEPMEG